LLEILRWTVERFGDARAQRYPKSISAALNDLSAGPTIAGATERDDIMEGISTHHVARKARQGRRFVMLRVGHTPEGDLIEVLRLLHDAMDLRRYLPWPAAPGPASPTSQRAATRHRSPPPRSPVRPATLQQALCLPEP
jgi:toxin ParE1/3/4